MKRRWVTAWLVLFVVSLLIGSTLPPGPSSQHIPWAAGAFLAGDRPAACLHRLFLPYISALRGPTMLISRFGATWANAYAFPELQASDDWQIERPPTTAQVSGTAGAFDFWGTAANPHRAVTVTKKFNLTQPAYYLTGTGTIFTFDGMNIYLMGWQTCFLSEVMVGDTIRFTYSGTVYEFTVNSVPTDDTLGFTTTELPPFEDPVPYEIGKHNLYVNIEAALDTLKQQVVTVGESKLWGLRRDSTHRWAWAKIIRAKYPEDYQHKLVLPVELEFYVREGVWYSETENSAALADNTSFPVSLVNHGNLPAAVRLEITPDSGTLTSLTLTNAGNGNTLTWTGSLASGMPLVIDTGQWLVTLDGDGAYSGLTFGGTQPNWLQLQPGSNAIMLATTGGSSWAGTLTWWDTYQ
jgi:Phage tail protein